MAHCSTRLMLRACERQEDGFETDSIYEAGSVEWRLAVAVSVKLLWLWLAGRL